MTMAVKRCCDFSRLPPEIIEWEILPRLPVKPLLRFKSVCKSWNSLISKNPDFIESHLVLNPNNDSLVNISAIRTKHIHDDDSLLQWYSEIAGSINGLVCFFNWHPHFQGTKVAIWNPATKQCLTDIPILPSRYEDRDLERDDYLGFGFDSVANDYKVIYLITIEEQPLVGEIYSCNRRCWEKITPSKFLFRGFVWPYPMPVSSRGCPFWLNAMPNGEKSRLITVIWFDVRNEVFKMLPEVCSIDTEQGYYTNVLMNFRDSVAVMIYDYRSFLRKSVDVYVLNERCSAWTKMSFGPIFGKEPTLRPDFGYKLFQLFRNDDVLFVRSDKMLCCVNLQTHAIKSLRKDEKSCHIVYACTYSESLVFIDGMEHSNEKEDQVGFFFLEKA